jgi:hypothetical protein
MKSMPPRKREAAKTDAKKNNFTTETRRHGGTEKKKRGWKMEDQGWQTSLFPSSSSSSRLSSRLRAFAVVPDPIESVTQGDVLCRAAWFIDDACSTILCSCFLI